MPTAKPEWIARVQPVMAGGVKIDAKSLNLIALVDEAAREHDLFGLVRLSNGQMSEANLSQPGVLDNLITLLEKTHPAPTDGLNYPGFTMDGGAATPDNAADLKALGVASAAAYKGVTTYFRSGMGAPTEWTGVVFPS
jgi:hypothetical protein